MKLRNFCIIAHIDHGKSTLADRMLEITGTIKNLDHWQALDTMDLEQERGITIKLTPVRMNRKGYELNLIDTPGHVDFQYEVSRSLAAVEWAILLVDAAQGVQAQTLSTLYAAMEHDLTIIPVLNKIDLPAADPNRRAEELENLIGIDKTEIVSVSAKTGLNVENLLDAIIDRIPSPIEYQKKFSQRYRKTNINELPTQNKELSRALIFDSIYDPYKGVVSYIKVIQWELSANKQCSLIHSSSTIVPTEVGYFNPKYKVDKKLTVGQIGYMVTWLKSVREAKVWDTVLSGIKEKKWENLKPYAIPGFKIAKPFIFAGVYPLDSTDYNKLQEAIEKLTINDSAISYEYEKTKALGQWFRCGFLGTLHMDIVSQRLMREFKVDTIFTLPSVTYLIKIKHTKSIEKIQSWYNIKELIKEWYHKHILPKDADLSGSEWEVANRYEAILKSWLLIISWGDMPEHWIIEEIREPFGHIEIVWPEIYAGSIMQLAQEYRWEMRWMEYLDQERVLWKYDMPMWEIIIDFYDKLKSNTKGYATMNYEFSHYQKSDLVRVDIFVNNERIESLSMVSHKDNAYFIGKNVVEKLKELIPKHLFPIPIQAGIGNRMIARETISALKKDVIAKCYGGDITRKRKLLAKQKEGKKKMKAIGSVNVPQDIFIKMLKR